MYKINRTRFVNKFTGMLQDQPSPDKKLALLYSMWHNTNWQHCDSSRPYNKLVKHAERMNSLKISDVPSLARIASTCATKPPNNHALSLHWSPSIVFGEVIQGMLDHSLLPPYVTPGVEFQLVEQHRKGTPHLRVMSRYVDHRGAA